MDTIFFVKIYITYSISLVAVGVGVTKGSINFGMSKLLLLLISNIAYYKPNNQQIK